MLRGATGQGGALQRRGGERRTRGPMEGRSRPARRSMRVDPRRGAGSCGRGGASVAPSPGAGGGPGFRLPPLPSCCVTVPRPPPSFRYFIFFFPFPFSSGRSGTRRKVPPQDETFPPRGRVWCRGLRASGEAGDARPGAGRAGRGGGDGRTQIRGNLHRPPPSPGGDWPGGGGGWRGAGLSVARRGSEPPARRSHRHGRRGPRAAREGGRSRAASGPPSRPFLSPFLLLLVAIATTCAPAAVPTWAWHPRVLL